MKRLVLLLLALGVLCAAGAGGYVLWVKHEGRDLRGSATVDFVPPKPLKRAVQHRPAVNPVAWPTYGFDGTRRRYDPVVRLRPPFRSVWTFHGHALLEFPPAVAYGRVYLPTFDGRFYALAAGTGETVWHRETGRCGWASPAVFRRMVYVTFLGHDSCNADPSGDGVLVAYDARSGAVRWSRRIGPTESSPLVAGGLVYVGDWNGRLWAFDARSGATRWVRQLSGEIKGSVAIAGRVVYIGSYDGHVYALGARGGRLIWQASSQARLGSSGSFYSTPAVAYGRVYVGSTDGKVYSFGATSGTLRWSQSTGGYVYASPAIWRRWCSWARTITASTRWTPRRATSAGASRRTARSRGQPASSPASSTSPRSASARMRSTPARRAKSGRGRTASTPRLWPTGTGSISSGTAGSTGSSSGNPRDRRPPASRTRPLARTRAPLTLTPDDRRSARMSGMSLSWYSAPMWVSSLNAGTPAITGGHTVRPPVRMQSQVDVSTNIAPARLESRCWTRTSLRSAASSATKQLEMSTPAMQLVHGCGNGVCPMTICLPGRSRVNAVRLHAMSALPSETARTTWCSLSRSTSGRSLRILRSDPVLEARALACGDHGRLGWRPPSRMRIA